MTADRDFLFWLHERLVHKYGENENIDFVQKLHAIAWKTPSGVDTPAIYQDPPGRYHLLGETSTIGPRWQIWDSVVKRAVITDITDQPGASKAVRVMNSLASLLQKEEEPVT